MTEKTAIEFLFFSYFNIDIMMINDDNQEKIVTKLLEAAITRAYRDASSHVLKFEFINITKDKEKDIIKKAYKKVGINLIKNRLEEYLKCNQEPNENWVEELAKELIGIYGLEKNELCKKVEEYERPLELPDFEKKNDEFTFGIAQKWINMTVKNIHVIDSIIKLYSKSDRSCLSTLCEKINDKKMDIPIDDYIIKASCKGLGVQVPSEKSNKYHIYNGFSDDYNKKLAWSNWELIKDQEINYYRAFQKKLKENEEFKKLGKNLLDRENRLWINAIIGKYDDK